MFYKKMLLKISQYLLENTSIANIMMIDLRPKLLEV